MQVQKQRAITLIALVITIVILLILAGVTINVLGGENGLISRVKQAKIEQMKAKAKEDIELTIMEIQMNKIPEEGEVTLQTLHDELPVQNTKIEVENYTSGQINLEGTYNAGENKFKYVIDDNFNVTICDEVESKLETVTFGDIKWNNGKAEVQISTKLSDTIEYQINGVDGTWVQGTTVTDLQLDDVLYARLTDGVNATEPEKLEIKDTIKPEEFGVTVTDLTQTSLRATGSTVDNQTGIANYTYVASVEATGNKIEYPNITETSYEITGLEPETEYTVYMLAYDKAGNIRKSSVENITTPKPEIQITTPIINIDLNATSSLGAKTQTRGTTLYINFSAVLEGTNCTIEPEVPYAVTSNGKYKFVVTGTYNGDALTKEIEVVVTQFQEATGLVQYDAGEWTQEEIDNLKKLKLYDLNLNRNVNSVFKILNSSGLNFTFGGFTYKGDTANASNISSGKVITSRNQSVSPQSGYGTPKYDGWQILSSTQSNGKTYVTKLIHAGSPENFVYYYTAENDAARAARILNYREIGFFYYLSGYEQDFNGYINARGFDEYRDKELYSKGFISEIHALRDSDLNGITLDLKETGAYYWIGNYGTLNNGGNLHYCDDIGSVYIGLGGTKNKCFGIRPVVVLNSGVYIESGDGTEASPYVLAIEE